MGTFLVTPPMNTYNIGPFTSLQGILSDDNEILIDVTDPAIENGLLVAPCAKAIVDGLVSDKSEVSITNFTESSLLFQTRLFPNYLFKTVRKMFKKRQVT